jgi:hypothetical protein
MADLAISPNYRQVVSDPSNALDVRTGNKHPLSSIDTKILVFEDRVKGWFFGIASSLHTTTNTNVSVHSGYVVLQVAVSQVEGIQQYVEGVSSEGKSRETFVRGMKRVFGPEANGHDALLEGFYSRVRCGLFHNGFTSSNVGISWDLPYSIGFGNGGIAINPRLFLVAVEGSFDSYVAELRDPAKQDLRTKFERFWGAA